MADVAEARFKRRILKRSVSLIAEKSIPMPHPRHEQVWVPIVVDVAERRRHRNRVRHPDRSSFRDVLEPSAPQVSPELVRTQLGAEIQIRPPIAIDVRHGDTVPVVVMRGLVVASCVIHSPVLEPNPTGVHPIRESETAKGLESLDRRFLEFPTTLELTLGVPMFGALGMEQRKGEPCR